MKIILCFCIALTVLSGCSSIKPALREAQSQIPEYKPDPFVRILAQYYQGYQKLLEVETKHAVVANQVTVASIQGVPDRKSTREFNRTLREIRKLRNELNASIDAYNRLAELYQKDVMQKDNLPYQLNPHN